MLVVEVLQVVPQAVEGAAPGLLLADPVLRGDRLARDEEVGLGVVLLPEDRLGRILVNARLHLDPGLLHFRLIHKVGALVVELRLVARIRVVSRVRPAIAVRGTVVQREQILVELLANGTVAGGTVAGGLVRQVPEFLPLDLAAEVARRLGPATSVARSAVSAASVARSAVSAA